MPTATKAAKVQPDTTKAAIIAEAVADTAAKSVKSTKAKTVKKPAAATNAPVLDVPVTDTKISPKKNNGTASEQAPSFTPYEPISGEEYMSDAQLAHFKGLLLEWKEQLVSEAESTKSYIQDESTAMPDINDRATQEEEFALALRTRDRERKLIRKIDKSLADMEAGDYGFCHTCGIEIGIRRLEARPTATQCIDCKTLSEMKEKQAWGHI